MFVSISVMFCFYFFECVLRHYYKYSDKKCFIIIDLLITELSSHLGGVTKEQTFNAYMEITNILGHAPQEDIETYTVINFLFMALQLNEDDEVENFLILDIYNEFNNILKNVYKLL